MKRNIFIILGMAGLIMATACGGGNANKENALNENGTESIEEAAAKNSFSQAAAELFIKKQGGLELEAIEPDWKYEIDEKTMANYGDSSHGSLRFQKPENDSLSRDDYEVWVRKVYMATKTISDDKRNIEGFENAKNLEEAIAERSLDEMLEKNKNAWIYLGMYSWGYRLNGKFMRVNTIYNEKKGHYSVEVDIAQGLNKPLDELLKEAEEAMEREDVQEALKELKK